jgi:hypothetical protein
LLTAADTPPNVKCNRKEQSVPKLSCILGTAVIVTTTVCVHAFLHAFGPGLGPMAYNVVYFMIIYS